MLRNEDPESKEKRNLMDDPWEPTGKKQKISQDPSNNSSTKAIMSGLDASVSSILEEDDSTSDLEMETDSFNQRQLETIRKEDVISQYSFIIDYSIQINEEEMIAVSLDFLKSQKLLVPYLTAVNYKIAFWAFEQESKIVLDELFKAPENRHQFLIVCHNNYQITKEFIHRSVQMSFEEFQQQAESKQYILNLLLRTKTHLLEPVIRSVIDEYSNNAEVDRETVNALKAMIDEITKELTLTEELADEVHVENPEFQAPKFN